MSKSLLPGLALVALAGAAPAAAIDLTGTWEGSYVCHAFLGAPDKVKLKPSTLRIAQTGSVIDANIDGTQAYQGASIDLAADPTKRGEAILNTCGIDAIPLTGAVSELVHFRAKVDPVKATGTLTGISIYESPLGGFLTCKLKYKRIDGTTPTFTGCP